MTTATVDPVLCRHCGWMSFDVLRQVVDSTLSEWPADLRVREYPKGGVR